MARDYLGKYGYTLRSLVNRAGEAVRLYRLEGWPTTVLVFYESGVQPEKVRDAIRAVGVW